MEDLKRAIASTSEQSPVMFLQEMEKHHVEERRITSIVRMLPLSSIDNQPKRLRIVRGRIAALRGVMDRRLKGVRDVAVEALTKLEQELH
ncbi:MAG TPA: hypothetical protein VN380_24960 [Thermoanaerobaculia bacterium]|nr:hypothetical protein [Thermoanaerobaculia bacterium]